MELRAYLDILSRRRWLVILATAVVAAVAGITSSLQTPLYRASASVLAPTSSDLVITAICPHITSLRSLVVPGETPVRIQVWTSQP